MTAENLQRYRDLQTRQYTTGLSDEERVEIAALFEEYIDRPPGEWTEAEWAVANAINDEAEADMEE